MGNRKKKVFLLTFFVFLAVLLPVTAYYLTTESSLDDRGEAAPLSPLEPISSLDEFSFEASLMKISEGDSTILTWTYPEGYEWYCGLKYQRILPAQEGVLQLSSPAEYTPHAFRSFAGELDVELDVTTDYTLYCTDETREEEIYSKTIRIEVGDETAVDSQEGEDCKFGDRLYGDVKNNGDIGGSDATAVLRHVVALETLNANSLKAADVNNDGNVDVSDAILILRKTVGLVDTFPICQYATEAEREKAQEEYSPEEILISLEVEEEKLGDNSLEFTLSYDNPTKQPILGGQIYVNITGLDISERDIKIAFCDKMVDDSSVLKQNKVADGLLISSAGWTDSCEEESYPFLKVKVADGLYQDNYTFDIDYERTNIITDYGYRFVYEKDEVTETTRETTKPSCERDESLNVVTPCPDNMVCNLDNLCYRGDIVGDGKITFSDFTAFVQDYRVNWRNADDYNARSDFNGDGKIDLLDYSIFRTTWFAFYVPPADNPTADMLPDLLEWW